MRNALAIVLLGLLCMASVGETVAQVSVEIPDLSGTSRETVQIPVNVGDLGGKDVISYEFTVSYDPSVLTVTGVDTDGTLSSDLSTAVNTDSTGAVTVSAGGTQALSGSGPLLFLTAELSTSGSTSLTWDDFTFNDGSPAATLRSGRLSIGGGGKVSVALPDTTSRVRQSLNVPVSIDDTTKKELYSYSFTVRYNSDVVKLTGASSAGTQSSDWSVEFQQSPSSETVTVSAAGTEPLSGDSALVDLVVEGRATGTSDLVFERVQVNEGTPSVATTDGSVSVAEAASAISISLPDTTGTAREPIDVPLSTEGITGDEGIYSYSFTVRYNSDVVRVADVAGEGTPSADWDLQVDRSPASGTVTVSAAGTEPLSGNSALVDLVVEGRSAGASDLIVERFQFNEGTPTVSTTDGSISVVESDASIALSVPDTTAPVRSSVTLPITTEELSGQGVYSYSLTLDYNPNRLRIADVVTDSTLSVDADVEVRRSPDAGTVTVTAAGTAPLSGRGALVGLVVEARTSGTSTLAFERVQFNEGTPPATTTAGRFEAVSGGAVPVVLSDTTIPPSESTHVPVQVNDVSSRGIYSYSFTLRYDPELVEITDVSTEGTVSESMDVTVNPRPDDGTLRVSAAGSDPITGAGPLLQLHIDPRSMGTGPLAWDSFQFNEGQPPASPRAGRLQVQTGQPVLYVDRDQSSSGDGHSWGSAFKSLQEALAKADTTATVSAIWVAEGTYYPDEGPVQDDRRDASFTLRDGLAVYGGFAGGEQKRSERAPRANATILSGNIGAADDSQDNSYHVVVARRVGSSTVLDGFTVQHGRADAITAEADGELSAETNGGGLFVDRGSPTIRNTIFRENYAENGGGVATVDFEEGEVEEDTLTLEGVRFLNNRAGRAGGGLFVRESRGRLNRTAFRGNVAEGVGGGMAAGKQAEAQAVSSLFSGNVAKERGGGLGLRKADGVTLINATVASNQAPDGGGIGAARESRIEVVNSIVWDNRATERETDQVSVSRLSEGQQAFSTIKGTPFGDTSAAPSTYPIFKTPISPTSAPTTAGNFQLQNISPVVDQGDAGRLPDHATQDLAGAPREQDAVDVGAYEGFENTVAVSPNRIVASEIVPASLTEETAGTHVQIAFSDPELESAGLSPPASYTVFRINPVSLQFSAVDTVDPASTDSTAYVVTDRDIDPGERFLYTVAATRGDGTQLFGGRSAARPQPITRPAIHGRVTSTEGAALDSAVVSLANGRASTQTDRNGRYLLEDLQRRRRKYEVEASHPGYVPETTRLPTFLGEKTFYRLDVELESRSGPVRTQSPTLFGVTEDRKLQTVRRGDVAHRYYVIPREDGEPIGGVNVHVKAVDGEGNLSEEPVPGSPFRTDNAGIVEITIDTGSEKLPRPFSESPSGDTRTFAITKAGGTKFDTPPRFQIKQVPRQYQKQWEGRFTGQGDLSVGFARGAIKPIVQANVDGSGTTQTVTLELQERLGVGVKEEIQPQLDVSVSTSGENDVEAEVHVDGLLEQAFAFPWPPNSKDAVLFFALYGNGVDLGSLEDRIHQLALQNYDQSRLKDLEVKAAGGLLGRGAAEANLNLSQFTGGIVDAGMNLGGELIAQFEVNGRRTRDVQRRRDVRSVAAEARLKAGAGAEAGLGLNLDFLDQKIEEGSLKGVLAGSEVGVQAFARPRYTVKGVNPTDFSRKLTLGYVLSGRASLRAFGLLDSLPINRLGAGQGFGIATTYTFQGDTFTQDGFRNNIGNDLLAIEEISDEERVDVSLNANSINSLAQDIFTEVNENQEDQEIEELSIEDGVQFKTQGRFRNLDLSIRGEVDVSGSGEQAASVGVELGAGFTSQYRFRAIRGRLYRYRHYETATFAGPSNDPLTAADVIGSAFTIALDRLKDIAGQSIAAIVDVGEAIHDTLPRLEAKAGSSARIRIGPGRSYLKINRSSIPPAVVEREVEFNTLSWSFFGGDPTVLRSDVSGRIQRTAGRKKARLQKREGLRYGVGGFYRFEPQGIELRDSSSTLGLYYQEAEVDSIDESELAIYREREGGAGWDFIGGNAHPDSNKVTANVKTLGTFTLAPRFPENSFGLTPDASTLPANGSATTQVTSEPIQKTDGTPVPDGLLYTVDTNLGSIAASDEAPDREGIQVAVTEGRLRFAVKAGNLSGTAQVVARSAKSGRSRGRGQVTFKNAAPPPAPQIESSYREGGDVRLKWSGTQPADFSKFQVYYDANNGEPPFDGISSTDPASPINVGRSDSVRVVGLNPDSTYFMAVAARDYSGARSNLSNVVRLDGRSSNQEGRAGANYPNPTSGQTTLTYTLKETQRVRIAIYDVLGRRIETVLNKRQDAGQHQVQYDASRLSSGSYFYQINGETFTDEGKMVVVR